MRTIRFLMAAAAVVLLFGFSPLAAQSAVTVTSEDGINSAGWIYLHFSALDQETLQSLSNLQEEGKYPMIGKMDINHDVQVVEVEIKYSDMSEAAVVAWFNKYLSDRSEERAALEGTADYQPEIKHGQTK